jgi:GNAT superfamily N-acetyltransferase
MLALNTSIRDLAEPDIPECLELSRLAGWNQTAEDWQLLLQCGIGECLAIDSGGRVVATTTLVCYGSELAWLGMVLTHPDFRKRGLARRLVEAALGIAQQKGVRTIKLDATALGSPLYRSLGFREEQTVERWSGTGALTSSTILMPPEETPVFTLDGQAFGADRGRILELLEQRATVQVEEDGFAMLRPGARASHLGPCIARSPESAKRLIGICLSTRPGEWYWDLLTANHAAVDLANEFNFKRRRVLVRMLKGPDISLDESLIYAGGGFEIG